MLKTINCVYFSIALLFMCGCGSGGKGLDRRVVSGKVSLDGKPLPIGVIQFTSLSGENPVVSGTSIQNGAYQLPAEGGLPPGKYSVSISSAAPPAAPPSDPDAAMKAASEMKPNPELIPPQYNKKSELTIEVGDSKEPTADFELKSKP